MALIFSRRSTLLLGTAALATPFIGRAQAQTTLEWVAGSLGGGWYTMAAGMSSLIAEENPAIRIRVVPGGGAANPTRVNNGQSPLGWGIDAFTAAAAKGEPPYTFAHDKLRSFGVGYSPTEHNLVRIGDSGPETMKEILALPNLRIGVPQRSSTDEMTLQRILAFLGSSPDKIRAGGGRYLNGSYADLGSAFADGQVDYVYVALAKPAALLTEMGQGRRPVKLVAFPQDVRDHLTQTYAYSQGVIPAGTYPTLQTTDIPVTTMDSVILANQSVAEDVAYGITRTLIKNKGPRLVQIHSSMGAFDPAVAWKYSGVPLHPGAAKAFREAGAMPA